MRTDRTGFGRGAWIGIVVVALLAAALLYRALRPSESGPTATTVPSESASTPATPEASGERLVDSVIAPDAQSGRTTPRFKPVLVDPTGSPVPGATVTWIPLGAESEPPFGSWPWIDPLALSARTMSAQSSEDGTFEFRAPLGDDARGSLLWITHRAHKARSFRLPPSAGLEALPRTIQLDTAAGITATVVDAAGDPVAGVAVHQRLALVPATRSSMPTEELDDALRLWRTEVTDDRGQAHLAPLPGRQIIDARTPFESSAPWTGSAPDQITLVLAPTFTCAGVIVCEDGTADFGGCSIEAFALIHGARKSIGRARVDPDGTFGPITLPRLQAEACEFELTGGPLVPMSLQRPLPAPGQHLQLQFLAQRGLRFPVLVVSDDGVPVRSAEVAWAWQNDDGWQWAVEVTDADGRATLAAAPAGPIWLEVTHPGFLGVRQELNLIEEVAGVHTVQLSRSGTIRGHVRADGRPVKDFTLVYKRIRDVREQNVFEVRDSKDGSYEFTSAPLGEVALFSVSFDRPRTATKIVQVEVGVPLEVDFDLPTAAVVRGVVVDADTGRPIAGATARLWLTGDTARLYPWGPHATAGADGTFELSGVSPAGANVLEIQALGYAPSLRDLAPARSQTLDLGRVQLSASAAIEVDFLADGGVDRRTFTTVAQGPATPVEKAFENAEAVSFGELPAGKYKVDLLKANEWSLSTWADARSRQQTRIEHDLRGRRQLWIEVDPGPDEHIPPGCVLRASFKSGSGLQCAWQQPLPPELRLGVGFLDARRFVFEVVTPDGEVLGSMVVPDADHCESTVRLVLGGVDYELRIVDRQGIPLSGVGINAGIAGQEWLRSGTSSGDGRFLLRRFPSASAALWLHRSGYGTGTFDEISLVRNEITDVVFDPTARIAVRLLDGGVPVPGAEIEIASRRGWASPLQSMWTDDAGLSRSDALVADEYELSIRKSALWPRTAIVRAADSTDVVPVQVRRRGGVVFRAYRAGLPAGEVSFEIVSAEFETRVRDWIQAGLANASPADMRTDGGGRLTIDGIPRGRYLWSTVGSDDGSLSGEVEVQPATVVEFDINLP